MSHGRKPSGFLLPFLLPSLGTKSGHCIQKFALYPTTFLAASGISFTFFLKKKYGSLTHSYRNCSNE